MFAALFAATPRMATIPKVGRSLFYRLFSSSSSASAPTLLPPPEAYLMELDDWTPTLVSPAIPMDLWTIDLGRWIFRVEQKQSPFRCSDHQLQVPFRCLDYQLHASCSCSDQELQEFYVNMLAKVMGREEAKKRVYLISSDPEDLGFCAYVDKETAYKVKEKNRNVNDVAPDHFTEARMKDPSTRPMRQCLQEGAIMKLDDEKDQVEFLEVYDEEGAIMKLNDEKDQVEFLEVCSKQEISKIEENIYRLNEEHLKTMTEMVDKKLEQQLVKEQAAQLKAKELLQAAQTKSSDEINKIKESLEKTANDIEVVCRIAESGLRANQEDISKIEKKIDMLKDEQLRATTEMVEQRQKETTLWLEKELAEYQAARLREDKSLLAVHTNSSEEISERNGKGPEDVLQNTHVK